MGTLWRCKLCDLIWLQIFIVNRVIWTSLSRTVQEIRNQQRIVTLEIICTNVLREKIRTWIKPSTEFFCGSTTHAFTSVVIECCVSRHRSSYEMLWSEDLLTFLSWLLLVLQFFRFRSLRCILRWWITWWCWVLLILHVFSLVLISSPKVSLR